MDNGVVCVGRCPFSNARRLPKYYRFVSLVDDENTGETHVQRAEALMNAENSTLLAYGAGETVYVCQRTVAGESTEAAPAASAANDETTKADAEADADAGAEADKPAATFKHSTCQLDNGVWKVVDGELEHKQLEKLIDQFS